MRKIIFLILFVAIKSSAQKPDALYERGVQLQEEEKFVEALAMFQQMVKMDSSNINYLTHASFLLCKVGNRQPTEAARQNYFRQAEYLAKKAIGVDSKNAEAHYNYALALGRINENAGSKQKIANAKLIKSECDAAVKLNPKHAGAYHVLGRWHRTVAGFNALEKMMINTLFGGVPEGGSYEAAIESFSEAITLEPDYLLHKYELALTYYERDKKDDMQQVKIVCNKILLMPAVSDDDKETVKKAKELMEKAE